METIRIHLKIAPGLSNEVGPPQLGCLLYSLAVWGWIRASLSTIRRGGRGAEEFAMPAWAVIAATDNAFDYYGPFTQYAGFLAAACVVLSRETEEETSTPLSGQLETLAGSGAAR